LYSVIFGRNAETLAEAIEFETEKVVAKDVHNPIRLKSKLDKVMEGMDKEGINK
jgi:hypothetical protein